MGSGGKITSAVVEDDVLAHGKAGIIECDDALRTGGAGANFCNTTRFRWVFMAFVHEKSCLFGQ